VPTPLFGRQNPRQRCELVYSQSAQNNRTQMGQTVYAPLVFGSEKVTWFWSGVARMCQNQRVFARSSWLAKELIVLDRFTWR
jgi:hypothetical protein